MRLDDEPSPLLMGHPLLFEKQKDTPVGEIHTENFQHNLDVLKNSQTRLNGIGLAASQIGWPARTLCLGITHEVRQRYPEAPDIPFQVWINPKIRAVSPTTCWAWEGCISVPGIRGWVERPSHIDVEGYNEHGEMVYLRMNDFLARVFQHELDHLNGMLFPMRIQDINLLVPDKALEYQQDWAKNWPTPNARKTISGALSPAR